MQPTNKDSILEAIFNSDSEGLLNVQSKGAPTRNADERLLSSFEEIMDFYQDNNHQEPAPNANNISEYQLYSRLKNLRESPEKRTALAPLDTYHLLTSEKKEIESFDDIFNDATFDLLSTDDEGLFDFKHTPQENERASADFVARRKPCKNFHDYQAQFKEIQKELATGKRKLIPFKEENLRQGEYYVHNGILFLLEQIDIAQHERNYKSGKRIRTDGRTRCVFENGTESNMLYSSVAKALYINGQVLTQNMDKVNEGFVENFSAITQQDQPAGYIYVLQSKSKDTKIRSISHLYKIGYSTTEVSERIKNAENEPTYLMAAVDYVAGWKCYNMNPQKFEQLIHNFFGNSCLEIDVFDPKGKRYTPREWFIAPIEIIEQAIELIINGKVIHYKYDSLNQTILKR